ncbi:hypothetical protein GXB81_29685 [Paraburkholderia sp. Ac-20336]|uniref:DUF5906 domain-containing protein n=1 Tax=Paraburkholderia sp. Ac-20336 TaxID=2703886 RepID=UPI00197D0158|nr:DUF5906 domain-containing protein [Paraburkholderia sp. Ac-20336]MBN3807179.1 hypothetical protein [Paraburkholderia sp. Ac-20336]
MTTNQNAADSAIAEVNKRYAVIMCGNKPQVMRESHTPDGERALSFMSFSDAANLLANVTVSEKRQVKGKDVDASTPVFDLWKRSPTRRQYEGLVLSPANRYGAEFYNLWSGFAVEPLTVTADKAAKDYCPLLLAHMKNILCCGNEEHFQYLMAWCADIVQDAEHKKGVALVLRGNKGTGKSIFLDAMRDIIGKAHAMKVAHSKQLTGNFNSHLREKVLVVAEESFWSGDKSADGPLKDLITARTVTIEAKGKDSVEMDSYVRVAMSTNNDWAVPATRDERRYFVLDVSDAKAQDTEYFSDIADELEAMGKEAFLRVLMDFDLSNTNLRKVPETDGLKVQKSLSLEPHHRFMYDLVTGSRIGNDPLYWTAHDANGNSQDSHKVGKDLLYNAYVDYARRLGTLYPIVKEVFSKELLAATGARGVRAMIAGNREQVFELPSIKDALARFIAYTGICHAE